MRAISNLQARLTPGLGGKWAWTVVFSLASGLAWAVLCRLVELQSIRMTWDALLSSEASLWLTGLLLGMPVLALSLLLHSLFAGNLIVGAAALLISFINYYKVLITSTPLGLGDFALARQVGAIATLNSASLYLSRNSILALAGAAAWLALSLLLSRPLRIPWGRSAAGGLGAVLAFVLLFGVGADAAIYTPLGLELVQPKSQHAVNKVCGAPLGLWRSLLDKVIREYSVGIQDLPDLDALLDPAEPAPEGEHPNVILILSESFFDVTRLKGVTYAEDPVPEFHALTREGVSGTFHSIALGYGTCNVELEIFTGLNTGLMGGEYLYAYAPETFSRVQALPGLLARNGYSTTMMHMHNDDTYHREDLFQYLGFETMYFDDDFLEFYPSAQAAVKALEAKGIDSERAYQFYMSSRISGTFFSDDLMSDALVALYEKMAGQSPGPVFLYGSSMEGHQPYQADKYSRSEITVSFTSPLTGEAEDALRVFSQSAHNASAALGKLIDYFRTCPEPTVIIFFGDHRPGLGLSDGDSVYSRLGLVPDKLLDGTREEIREVYSTDYLIWANDPDLLPGDPGSTWDTSCGYLGAQVLDLAGVPLPTYWRLIDRLGQSRVADNLEFHLDRAGNLSDKIAEDDPDAQLLDALRIITGNVLVGTGTAPE